MEFELARNWWVVALRGVLAILFGLVAFLWPFIWLTAVVYIFAAYALVGGAFALAAVLMGGGRPGRWWVLLLEGLAGIAFGVVTFAWPWAPVIEVTVLAYFIGYWLMMTGILQVIAAVRLHGHARGAWLFALGGILSVLLGAGYVFFPGAGLWVLAIWTGAYSVAFGALLLALAFQLRGMGRYASNREGLAVP
jgi:uncharacterized membrane protein HdeD (DUF308 family)